MCKSLPTRRGDFAIAVITGKVVCAGGLGGYHRFILCFTNNNYIAVVYSKRKFYTFAVVKCTFMYADCFQ